MNENIVPTFILTRGNAALPTNLVDGQIFKVQFYSNFIIDCFFYKTLNNIDANSFISPKCSPLTILSTLYDPESNIIFIVLFSERQCIIIQSIKEPNPKFDEIAQNLSETEIIPINKDFSNFTSLLTNSQHDLHTIKYDLPYAQAAAKKFAKYYHPLINPIEPNIQALINSPTMTFSSFISLSFDLFCFYFIRRHFYPNSRFCDHSFMSTPIRQVITEVKSDDFIKLTQLNHISGAQGKLFLYMHKSSGRLVVFKTYDNRSIFETELSIYEKMMDHPCIVPFVGKLYRDATLILQFMAGGDLSTVYLDSNVNTNPQPIRTIYFPPQNPDFSRSSRILSIPTSSQSVDFTKAGNTVASDIEPDDHSDEHQTSSSFLQNRNRATHMKRTLSTPNINRTVQTEDKIEKSIDLDPTIKTLIIIRVLFAIDHMHKIGIIHKDIKPQNILLDNNGNGYLCDFGSALKFGVSNNGGITPFYASPEALNNQEIHFQTDLYSLGDVIYELAVGSKEPAFKRILRKQKGEIIPLSTEYGKIVQIYQMCQEKEPIERTTSLFLLDLICNKRLFFADADTIAVNEAVNQLKTELGYRIQLPYLDQIYMQLDGQTPMAQSHDNEDIREREDIKFIIQRAETDARCQFQLGYMYYEGTIFDRDVRRAVELWEKAGEQPFALFYLGYVYQNGYLDGKIDKTRAFYYFERSAKLEFDRANFNLGLLYSQERPRPKEFNRSLGQAKEKFSLAAKQGNLAAYHKLAMMEEERNKETKKMEYLRIGAQKGSASCQFYLATSLLKNPNRTMSEEEEGYLNLTRAMNQDDKYTDFLIAREFFSGVEIPTKNLKESFKFFQLAANQKHKPSLFYVGLMYLRGLEDPEHDFVLPPDRKKAKLLIKASADMNHIPAHYMFGKLEIEDHNYTTGIEHLKIASDQNDMYGQFEYAYELFLGKRIPRDTVQSFTVLRELVKRKELINSLPQTEFKRPFSYSSRLPTVHRIISDALIQPLSEIAVSVNALLGLMYDSNIGFKPNDPEINAKKQAEHYYFKAANAGDAMSMYRLYKFHQRNGIHRIGYLQRAAEKGLPIADCEFNHQSKKPNYQYAMNKGISMAYYYQGLFEEKRNMDQAIRMYKIAAGVFCPAAEKRLTELNVKGKIRHPEKCELIEMQNNPQLSNPWNKHYFECIDCGIGGGLRLCCACACWYHSNHRLIDLGIMDTVECNQRNHQMPH